MDKYKSPIEIIYDEIAPKIEKDLDSNIMKAIVKYDIKVDKEELLKALAYDRDQYHIGYISGYKACLSHIESFYKEHYDKIADFYGGQYE